MKRFFVRCVGQFLCFFGLTSVVSDARASVDAENYSCSMFGTAVPWYVGWPAYGQSAPWGSIQGMCQGNYCVMNSNAYMDMSGVSVSFSVPSDYSLGSYSSYPQAKKLCLLPTDGYMYHTSGNTVIRPGCAMRGGDSDVLYAVKSSVFSSTYGCTYISAAEDTPTGAYSGATGSGASGYTPPCYYTEADTLQTAFSGMYTMYPITAQPVRCTFQGCKSATYKNYILSPSNPTVTFRVEPGGLSSDSPTDDDFPKILIGYYSASTTTKMGTYYRCTETGCQTTTSSTELFYKPGGVCEFCSSRYDKSVANAQMSSYTMNWGTSAAGIGYSTCRLSSYQGTLNNGTYRVPCNNAAPQE